MKIDDALSDIFDVTPINNSELKNETNTIVQTNDALEYDYQTTRSNLHSILTQGQVALFHALEVAKQSEHPRAFEVVGGLMKNLSDINTQLLDLHKKKQAIDLPMHEDAKTNTVTNNAIFVGSTNELSKMLDDLRKGK